MTVGRFNAGQFIAFPAFDRIRDAVEDHTRLAEGTEIVRAIASDGSLSLMMCQKGNFWAIETADRSPTQGDAETVYAASLPHWNTPRGGTGTSRPRIACRIPR
jgi:hypothetical protein